MVCGQNFYPRSPCGERLTNANSPKSDNIISIHALLAESDTASSILMVAPSNFYPRSPCGERLGRLMLVMALSDFYPRSPCGERPVTIWLGYVYLDFYPRSPCGERQGRVLQDITPAGISIHALLAESDCKTCRKSSLRQNFYPRSPCGERPLPSGLQCGSTYFYPRSPCGERQNVPDCACTETQISIHALLAESDALKLHLAPIAVGFLSTLSLRRATGGTLQGMVGNAIFLSTLSLRRATFLMERDGVQYYISIHALLAESDQLLVPLFRDVSHFYPRSPCGERPCSSTYRPLGSLISIHALLAESDFSGTAWVQEFPISIHALLAESDLINTYHRIFGEGISIHALLAESDYDTSSLMQCQVKFLSTLSLRRATADSVSQWTAT